jgi:endoglucanase
MSNKLVLASFILSIFICTFIKAQIPVPETGCYHSAFTGTDNHQQFETLAQKNIAIEMFFMGWPSNFPTSKCTEISNNGAIPHITWMPQVSGSPYPLDGIINGTYDNYIKSFADGAKTFAKPLFIRLGHEFNGDWYTYGGANNGGGTLNGFGDPSKADGPERFIAAYKRVHDLFAGQGVTNVVWIWCLNNGSSPNVTWNVSEAYYPGDSYVDWIGFDGYNFGTTQSWSNWLGFWDIYYPMYSKFKSYNKPMMIAEFASVENGGNKADWIRNAYLSTRFSFPKIKAITWFHIAKTEGTVFTDWRINSSSASLAAYQTALSDAYYLGSIITDLENEQENIPTEFSLQQNYPNPFNPSTKIKFTIPSAPLSLGEGLGVRLIVYDILGNEVVTLVDEYKPSGNYEVDFNASGLASGMYLYKLQVGLLLKLRR